MGGSPVAAGVLRGLIQPAADSQNPHAHPFPGIGGRCLSGRAAHPPVLLQPLHPAGHHFPRWSCGLPDGHLAFWRGLDGPGRHGLPSGAVHCCLWGFCDVPVVGMRAPLISAPQPLHPAGHHFPRRSSGPLERPGWTRLPWTSSRYSPLLPSGSATFISCSRGFHSLVLLQPLKPAGHHFPRQVARQVAFLTGIWPFGEAWMDQVAMDLPSGTAGCRL